MRLSKSKIIAFRQCPKRLWLEVHRPELREESAGVEARYAVGHQVGEIARKLYDPKGEGARVDVQGLGYAGALALSARLAAAHKKPVFEMGFSHEDTLAFADVMLPVGRKGWRMIEVKSSGKVKDYHTEDVAVQAHLAKGAKVCLDTVAIAHIDTKWTYPGGENYRGLLVEEDVTEATLARDNEAAGWIREAHQIANLAAAPAVEMGEQCSSPFDCPFCNHCSGGVPAPENPIDWLPRLGAKKREQLDAGGITRLQDIPDSLLNNLQRRVRDCTVAGKAHLDPKMALLHVGRAVFPRYYLDFETIQFAVPIWAGTRPYENIPFQYSLHIETALGDVVHREFLDTTGEDLSRALAERLIADCGRRGPVFVYNMSFESRVLKRLGERFWDLAERLYAISGRIVDLLPVARECYYHPDQKGSFSIKAVLPTAVPELSYDTLEGVQDGEAAMAAYLEAIAPETPAERSDLICSQLLSYCKLDTLAMVKLRRFLCGERV